MTTLTNLTTAVRSRMGIPTTDGLIDDASITQALNRGLDDISMRYPWPWLDAFETISTADGTDSEAPAADWVQTISLRVNDVTPQHQNMTRIPMDMVDGLQQGTAHEGVPVYYSIFGDTIFFVPTPAAVYAVSHRYRKSETALSAGGDTPALPSHHDGLVIEYAVAMLFRRTRQMDDSAAAMERYERMLEDTAQRHGLSTRDATSTGGGQTGSEV